MGLFPNLVSQGRADSEWLNGCNSHVDFVAQNLSGNMTRADQLLTCLEEDELDVGPVVHCHDILRHRAQLSGCQGVVCGSVACRPRLVLLCESETHERCIFDSQLGCGTKKHG